MNKTLLLLLSCAALLSLPGCKSFPLPVGKDLRLTQLLGQSVPSAADIVFRFDDAEKKIAGKAGCNNFSASYKLKGSKLTFSEAMSTKMTCPHQDWENKFLGMLSEVKSVRQAGNKIQLLGDGGKTLAALTE